MDPEECSTGLVIEKHWNFYLFFSFYHTSFHLLMKKKFVNLNSVVNKPTYLRQSRANQGDLGQSWAIFRYLWLSLTISDYLIALAVFCKLGQSRAISDYLWLSIAISGYLWLSLAISANLWQFLAVSDNLGQTRAILGHLKPSWVISGYLWLSLTIWQFKLSGCKWKQKRESYCYLKLFGPCFLFFPRWFIIEELALLKTKTI